MGTLAAGLWKIYDTLDRLTAFRDGPAGAAIEQYTYDATGNRTSFTNAHGTQAYSYPTDNHRLTAVGAEARTFDAMGNTTSIGGTEREFAYNAAGRMSEVQRDNVVAMQYGYNGKGEQVRKHLGTSNAYALYDESGQWLGAYGNTGAPNQQIVWLDSLPVGVIANGQLNYIEADHLGTPRAVIEPQRVWRCGRGTSPVRRSATACRVRIRMRTAPHLCWTCGSPANATMRPAG